MDRRSPLQVLFYALQCAKSDRTAYADAVAHDRAAHADALADIRAFEQLQVALFGTSKSSLDSATTHMEPVTVFDLKRMIESIPNAFVHSDKCECNHCRPTRRTADVSS